MIGFGSQRGNGRVGCLVTILVATLFGFLCINIVPVYISKLEFEEEMSRLVSRAGSRQLSVRSVEKNVARSASVFDFEIDPKTLRVSQRGGGYARPPELRVEVTYFRVVDLVGYKHRFQFRYKGSSFVGAL